MNQDLPLLNIAHICKQTKALGPGIRFVIWVQGCCFSCSGCISPKWVPQVDAQIMKVEQLALEILMTNNLEGITISGGEPFLQAYGLSLLLEAIKKVNPDLSVISFSGFTLKEIEESKNDSKLRLLSNLDLLIDGKYQKEKNTNQGFRGSENQNFQFITERYRDLEEVFKSSKRDQELQFEKEGFLTVGIPPLNFLEKLKKTLKSDNSK
ncbi:MAG: anaerobic ribonucleoside-triphosphate reductase activating protein [bacterium]|jgi:anaerobic ribonucleoside-triphosphate reductase activating protein